MGKIQISGQQLINAFCKHLNCSAEPGRGDHVKIKGTIKGQLRIFPIPLYETLPQKLLSRIKREAGLTTQELRELLEK